MITRFVRKTLTALVGFIFIGMVGYTFIKHQVEEWFPASSYADLQGNQVKVEDWLGKWVLVNYWAEWCGPCIKEIPEFDAFYRANKDKVVVIGVNYDAVDTKKQIAFLKKLQPKPSYIFLRDNPNLDLNHDDIQQLPVTFVISPQGELDDTLLGPQTQASLAKATGLSTPQPSKQNLRRHRG